jgi:hypothetical protein
MSGRGFAKGADPRRNAGGQRKVTKEARNLAADATPDNMRALIDLRDGSPDEWVRLEAIKQLNAYGLGKPVAHIQKTVEHVKRSPRDYTMDELLRLARGQDTPGETH